MTHKHTVYDLERIFKKAAGYGVSEWNRPYSEVEELKQKLWEWYLRRPSTQEKLQTLKAHEVTNLVKRIAIQIMSEAQVANNKWENKNHYEPENIKAALKGEEFNPYLVEILPEAFKTLEERNKPYAESLRSRYFEGVVPEDKSDQNRLVRAHKALTDIVNTIAITAEMTQDAEGNTVVKDGPGSRRIMQKKRPRYKHEEHPEVIKGKGDHSDPTANIAIMLIENPELKEEYLYEPTLQDFLRGSGA